MAVDRTEAESPALSVVVVSDYEAGSQKTWRDELRMVEALARQDLALPFEVIVVESARHRHEPPPERLFEAIPDLRLTFVEAEDSATMKNHGVTVARGAAIALVEADSAPEADWLGLLSESLVRHPEVDAVSGRTHYGQDSSYQRVMGLLDRSYNDSGVSRECSFVSNNGALYRAGLLRDFPYVEGDTPFLSAQLRNRRMKAAGHRFYFERAALMRHEIGGASFLFDLHMNFGHMQMALEPEPKRVLARVPALLGKLFWHDLRRYRWLGRSYLRWWDWPLAAALLIWVRLPEAVGMLRSLRGEAGLEGSAYR